LVRAPARFAAAGLFAGRFPAARGFRLNIAAGTAVRFEPGQEREVELVALAGDRIVYGFNGKVMGRLDAGRGAPPPPKRAPVGKSAAKKASDRRANGGRK
jgi:hypothetical protein